MCCVCLEQGAVTPVKDHANNAALPVGGGASPVFKSSPSQFTPPQRDKPAAAHRGREKEGQGEQQTRVKVAASGDGGEGGDYSESFEDDDTHSSASLDEQARNNAGENYLFGVVVVFYL